MENDLVRERSESFFPKCQASNAVPYRKMVSDAIKQSGGGRGIKACTIPANIRAETSKSSTAHLQAVTFDIWLGVQRQPIRKTRTTHSEIYVLFVLLIPFAQPVFCSPITSTTLAWKYLNLLFRCLVVERTRLRGHKLPLSGPGQQVSNEHLF